MSYESLEQTIQALRNDQCSKPNSTIKRLRTVLKVFGSYSNTDQKLPPQTLIPICLFSLPNILNRLLGLQEDQLLESQPQKSGLKLSVQLYLKGLLRLLSQCEDEIKHVVVQSMSKSILLTPAFPALCRKWVRALVEVWCSSSANLNLTLRCFIALNRLMRGCEEQMLMWSLRRVYVGYFQHCGQVTWRSLEHINFMANSFCQLVKINPSRSYYVLFGYIRTLAVQIQSLNKLRGKQKIDLASKLYSQQTLQIIRLLSRTVCRSGQQELSALTYPLAQIINAYEHISESPEYLPLKLHLIEIELQFMQQTGLYLPHCLQALLKVFKSSPLQKKLGKKAGVQGSIELGFRLSADQLQNTNYINDIFNKAVYHLYWLQTLASKTLAGVQIIKSIHKKVSEIQFAFMGYRKQIKQAADIMKKDSRKLNRLRQKRKMVLGQKSSQKFQSFLNAEKLTLQGRMQFAQLKEEHETMIKVKVVAEHEDQQQSQKEYSEPEDAQEVDSGWEQASEGASQFNQQEKDDASDSEGELQEREMESISYEGDPQDADEAVKQWSQHSWSSQQALDDDNDENDD